MTAIQLQKNWSINPNVRNSYVSLADMAGWFIYENHAWMKTHGWTVKFTCGYDGVSTWTGPTNSLDTTDRIVDKTAASGRGANATSFQSWTVLTSATGVDLLIAYQGASDDVIRLSYSVSGSFVLNGTDSRYQPTAVDEVAWCNGTSVISSATSNDRVMSIWAADDGKNWSCAIWRQGSLLLIVGLEYINSACAPTVFDQPYIALKYSNATRGTGDGGGSPTSPRSVFVTGPPAAGWRGALVRVFTLGSARVLHIGAGSILLPTTPGGALQSTDSFLSNTPALQAGSMPLFPLFLSTEKNQSGDGFVGVPPDWWVGYGANVSTPATGDFFPGFDVLDDPQVDSPRTNWFVALGAAMIRPWKDVAVSLETV